MWFDPVGVEQATAEAVARHKARRFDEGGTWSSTSARGSAATALALAESSRVIAVDLDAGMGRRTLWNAGVYGVADRVMAVRGRAESFPIPSGARVHVDPDRRAGGRPRAKGLADYVPGLDVLLGGSRPTPRGGALKLGPASDFEAHFGGPGFEIEVVSLGGECKEATVWFGDLAGRESAGGPPACRAGRPGPTSTARWARPRRPGRSAPGRSTPTRAWSARACSTGSPPRMGSGGSSPGSTC